MTDKRVLLMLNQPPTKCPLDRQLTMLEGVTEKGALLMQDAVLHAVTEAEGGRLLDSGFKVYALRPSVEARGVIDRIIGGVELVDYHRVVDLIMTEYDIVV